MLEVLVVKIVHNLAKICNLHSEGTVAQDPKDLIHLVVHESADPSIMQSRQKEANLGNNDDLNDSVHDDENVDVPIPQGNEPFDESTVVDHQITVANLSAG